MSKTYIPTSLRQEVLERAGGCCEYCRLNLTTSAFNFTIDHIIAEKHDGETLLDNLCLSCFLCNSFKGSDLTSVDREYGFQITPLFNPRLQQWDDHFVLQGSQIIGRSGEGRVTAKMLQFNTSERMEHRTTLIRLGSYPCVSL
jgi:hypothetical protein